MKLSGESQAELIKFSILGIALYFAYQAVKNSVSETFDLVKNVDLNPFDEAGWLGLTLQAPTEAKPRISGYDASHIEAMRKIGLDIKKYRVWYPNPFGNTPKPAGTIQVKWGAAREKITYYAPNTALDIFMSF